MRRGCGDLTLNHAIYLRKGMIEEKNIRDDSMHVSI